MLEFVDWCWWKDGGKELKPNTIYFLGIGEFVI
jgi:hypothetical protein